jgi:hypothetical protein
MRTRVLLGAALALVLLAAVAAVAWTLASSREARQLRFQGEGTGLQANDVDTALRELARKVRDVEGGQVELRGVARSQQAQLSAVQGQVAQTQSTAEQRLTELEARAVAPYAQRRRIDYSEGSGTSAPTAQYASLRNFGSFTKSQADSEVLLTWNSHIDAMGEPGTFCDFQLRIDGRPDVETEGGGGRAVVYVPAQSAGGSSPVTVSALFGRVGAGHHTVGLHVRGTARECLENYGNFPRSVIVEESGRGSR